MKKLLQLLAVPTLVAAAFVAANTTTVSAATQSCKNVVISNTGQGSTNIVTCADTEKITIECKNDTKIVLDVDQNAQSGTAKVSENTTGGSAKSGDVVNINQIDALIDNNNCFEEEDRTPETPEVPTPTEPTAPEGEVQGEVTVTALPETGVTTPLQILALVAGALMAVALAGRLVIATYARGQK